MSGSMSSNEHGDLIETFVWILTCTNGRLFAHTEDGGLLLMPHPSAISCISMKNCFWELSTIKDIFFQGEEKEKKKDELQR